MRYICSPPLKRLGAILGPCWGRLGPYWAALGRLGAILGCLGAALGPPWAVLNRLVPRLGSSWVVPGPLRGLSWGRWEPSSGVSGPSWSHHEASWSHLGTILGPSWALLSCLGASWCHRGLSWSRLRAVLETSTSKIAEMPSTYTIRLCVLPRGSAGPSFGTSWGPCGPWGMSWSRYEPS